jgi:hypothetical protein
VPDVRPPHRGRRRTRAKRFSAAAAAGLVLCGCGVPFDERAAAYVVMDPATAETFLNDFTQIAAARGLSPNYGRADRSDGRTLHVVEASGRALVVWVQNMPLSERQCPEMADIDAGQFSLNVRPAMWFPFPGKRAVSLSQLLTSDLREKGYRVTSEAAVPCSSAVPEAERRG